QSVGACLVGNEGAIVVGQPIARQRLESLGRPYIGSRRPVARAALLFALQVPGQEELGRIGMRRILEYAGDLRPYRHRLGLREGNRDRLAGARHVVGVLGYGIEGEALVARRHGAAYAQMTADERQGVRLQTLQQVRIFLGQNGEEIERYIVDVRIGGDDLVLEGGSGEIERSARHALGFYLLRVVGIDETVHVDADIGAVIVLPAAVDLLEAVRL